MTDPDTQLMTSAAAKFCSSLGRPTSASALRKFRQSADERGPPWVRDPVTQYVRYRESALRAWVQAWCASLATTRMEKPAHLRTAA